MRTLIFCAFIVFISCENQTENEQAEFITPFEVSEGLESATYAESIDFYMRLAREFSAINIQTIGETDSGLPLHIVTFNPQADFNFQKLAAEKVILLINNGIHPGESDGIDASMMLFRDLAQEKIEMPERTVVVTIPIYNVGGAMKRSSTGRVNQNGPLHYGFRGNARNFDLNRDFIKNDTKNAETFAQIYHLVQPDIFVDTHVSNGADYQYVLTHLFTQHNKLGGDLGRFLEEKMIPFVETRLAEQAWPVTPYVNIFNAPPETGFAQFMDNPRYSTGYTSLWNSLGLMIETHMLKPYEKRVQGTYEFLNQLIAFSESQHDSIKSLRKEAVNRHKNWKSYPTKWSLDSTKIRTLSFKGYKADTITSAITGFDRLKYDQEKPVTLNIAYYNNYKVTDSVEIPAAYILGKEWRRIIDLMELNRIKTIPIVNDTVIEVQSYRIKEFKTTANPYEGHYLHYDTQVTVSTIEKSFSSGDLIIPTDQAGIRYLLETLEPEAVDSFFNWNFFDPLLQLKEGFSPYVFEDLALEILDSTPGLRDSLASAKSEDPALNANWYAQLKWIYERSDHLESSYMQYPVYRILSDKN